MNIACPYCRAVLKIKALKTGKHTPQCPKCHNPFIVVVPEDETGTIKVQPIHKKPPTQELPDTVRLPATQADTEKHPVPSKRPAMKSPTPSAETTDLRDPGKRGKPAEEADDIEDAAAALLESDDTDVSPPRAKPK